MKKEGKKKTSNINIAVITAILSELSASATSMPIDAGKDTEKKTSKKVKFDFTQVDATAAELWYAAAGGVSAVKFQKILRDMRLNNSDKKAGGG